MIFQKRNWGYGLAVVAALVILVPAGVTYATGECDPESGVCATGQAVPPPSAEFADPTATESTQSATPDTEESAAPSESESASATPDPTASGTPAEADPDASSEPVAEAIASESDPATASAAGVGVPIMPLGVGINGIYLEKYLVRIKDKDAGCGNHKVDYWNRKSTDSDASGNSYVVIGLLDPLLKSTNSTSGASLLTFEECVDVIADPAGTKATVNEGDDLIWVFRIKAKGSAGAFNGTGGSGSRIDVFDPKLGSGAVCDMPSFNNQGGSPYEWQACTVSVQNVQVPQQ